LIIYTPILSFSFVLHPLPPPPPLSFFTPPPARRGGHAAARLLRFELLTRSRASCKHAASTSAAGAAGGGLPGSTSSASIAPPAAAERGLYLSRARGWRIFNTGNVSPPPPVIFVPKVAGLHEPAAGPHRKGRRPRPASSVCAHKFPGRAPRT
jgi:hypothetical protein